MNRILLLVLVLAALGAGAWLLLQDGGAPVVTDPPSTTEKAAPQPEAGRLSAPEAVDGAAATGLSRSEAPAAAAADPKAPVYATPAAEGEGFLVRVVRKEGGAPIPFADVFFVDVANLDQQKMMAAQAESHSILEMIEQLAVRYRAGADGSVRLPLPGAQVWLAARQDRWFGTFNNQAIPRPGVILECTQMSAVSARVTDADGRPQRDIPVQLRALENGSDQVVMTVRTDASGIGLFQPLDMLLREGTEDVVFALTLGGILAEPVRAEFDVRRPPEEPLALLLPPHGLLEVRVTAADGKPWMDPAFIQAVARDADVNQDRGSMEGEGLNGMLREGVLLLRPLGLAQPVRVSAMRPDGTTIGETLCEGPGRHGETVHVEILEQSGASVVTGRAVHPDGMPLSEARLQYELELESFGFKSSKSSNRGQIVTGKDGSFRLEIEEPALDEDAQRRLKLRAGGTAGAAEAAEVDLSWSLPPGATDLGNVVLALPPLLVSGVVVDESGAPIAGVTVQARPQVFYDKEQFYWSWESDFQGRSGADGSFALHGTVDSPLIRVNGSDEKHWCAGVDVPPGSASVTVVMKLAGRVAGTLLLDEGVKSEGFSIYLVSDQEGDREVTNWGAQIQTDGSFEFGTVPPGIYRLELSPFGSRPEPVATLEGLQVVAGEACADPRLNPFDARGKVKVLRVRAVDENGKTLRHFQVIEQRVEGNGEHFWAFEDEAVLPHRETPSDLLVMKEGCLTVRLEDVKSDCEVRLVPGPRIRISLSGAGSLPEGHRLVLGLKAAEGSVESLSGPSVDVDAAGVAEFSAPLTGLCTVTLMMYGTKDDITYAAWVELLNAEVEVRPSSATQSFTVSVDPGKLQEAMEQIAKQRGS